ncbi:extracellular solute-binding protein [Streptomyces sp. NPDC006978]|uniref:extracellular solute-binding protein n=1 Tax=Streptomyces sp. NPDC006978 TaxID=3364769 RepID=UPI0036CE9EAA
MRPEPSGRPAARRTSGWTLDGPVVVGTDGTPDAHRAVRWAAVEADSRERPLTLVHATRTESGHPHLSLKGFRQAKDHAVDVLVEAEALVRKAALGVKVVAASCPQETAACLLREAGQEGAVVVGTRGHGGFLGLLVGSDALPVAARARVPAVMVPPRERDRPAGVVMVAARDDRDREAVRPAVDLALRRGASLCVVSVWIFLENVGSMAAMFDDPSEMATVGPWAVSAYKDSVDIGVAPVPTADGKSPEDTYSSSDEKSAAMFSACRNRATAWDLLKFATSAQQDGEFLEATGQMPMRENLTARYPDYFQRKPVYQSFAQQAEHVVEVPNVPGSVDVWQAFRDEWTKSVVFGEEPTGTALRRASAKMSTLLDEYGGPA